MARNTPAGGTAAVDDITTNPPMPDFSDLPSYGEANGNGQHYTQDDLRMADLEGWLQRQSIESITETLAKAREYGGQSADGDLNIMAGAMRILVPNLQTHEQAVAAVLAFYQLGKVARNLAALGAGRMPSISTLRDTAVYATMQQRVQETGRWL